MLPTTAAWRRVKRSAMEGRQSLSPSGGLKPRVLEALAAVCAELHAGWDSGVHRPAEAA